MSACRRRGVYVRPAKYGNFRDILQVRSNILMNFIIIDTHFWAVIYSANGNESAPDACAELGAMLADVLIWGGTYSGNFLAVGQKAAVQQDSLA